jgi:hypothetical protein
MIVAVLGVCLGLGAVAQAAKSAKEPAAMKRIPKMMRENGFKHNTAAWTTVMTQTDENGKTSSTDAKMWISGDKYRMESKDKQNNKTMVFLDDGKDVYMINMDEKKAYKWGPSAESMFGQVMSSDMVAESARQRKTAKKLGKETVEGKPCDIYAYKSTVTFMNNSVSSDVKEWCWTKENFPIKNQIKTPKHQMKIVFMTTEVPATETVSVVKDLVLDKPVEDALFTVPAGVKVETLEVPEGAMGTVTGNNTAAAQNEKPTEGKTSKSIAEQETKDNNKEEAQNGPPPAVKNMLKGLF